MKKLIALLLIINSVQAQSLSPKVIATSGGYFAGGANSLSWTMGETFTTTLSSANNKLTQGFQQPWITVTFLNLKAFIEGFYRGTGNMTATIDPVNYPNNTDTIILELASGIAPYSILYSDKEILHTDGSSQFHFNGSVIGGNYFLILRHRNALETWSANPITITANITYDFTNLQSNAFGNNLADLGDGNFALFSGDVNQDGIIDQADFMEMETNLPLFPPGYLTDDLTGDWMVESSDYSLLENNIGKNLLRP